MGAPQLCRLDELGMFLFRRLCRELLVGAAADDDWHGSLVPLSAGLQAPELGVDLDAPALALAAWIRPSPPGDSLARLRRAIALTGEWFGGGAPNLLVLTNVAVPAGALGDVAAHVLDARALSAIVLAQPSLFVRLPSLLGICDPEDVLPTDARVRSTGDVEAALELARTFVPTRAYGAAAAVVEHHGFAVLTGPPEMGKTAIARMLGLAQLACGWELHECIRPEQLWERFAPDRPQVFVADDAFGSTEYRPDAAERWAVDLERAIRTMDDRHWLLWTSRPAPLKAALGRVHREHGVERFPKPAQVEVDASDLDVGEKALMLFRHAKAAALPEAAVAAVRAHGWTVVSHRHFTPERIRRFVAGRLATTLAVSEAEVAAEIREPTRAMAESFGALEPHHRAVLVALLDVPPGPVAAHELSAAARRHSSAGIPQRPSVVVDRLAGHFLRVGAAGAVTWVHPSWRDLVIDELAGDSAARAGFLRVCSLEGILLAVSVGGGAGRRSLPLLVADADWDIAAGRLAELMPALEPPDTTRLLAALEAALAEAPNAELDALAAETLERLARAWARRRELVPVGLLAAWAAVRACVSEPPPVPDTTAIWLQQAPTADAEPRELGEWLTLAELLAEHAPEQLRLFGFPERYLDSLDGLLARVEASGERDWVRALRQLAAVIPERAARAHDVIAELQHGVHRDREAAETYVPRTLPSELQRLLDTQSTASGADERLVVQVLRDL